MGLPSRPVSLVFLKRAPFDTQSKVRRKTVISSWLEGPSSLCGAGQPLTYSLNYPPLKKMQILVLKFLIRNFGSTTEC